MRDLSQIDVKFKEYERKIQKLKHLEKELNSLDTKGFDSEVLSIRDKLKDPKRVDEIGRELSVLRQKIDTREKEEIENLAYEAENITENAIPNTKDPKILAELRHIQRELTKAFLEFESGVISYADAKSIILKLKTQAKVLSTPKETHYDILGIDPKASQDEIKKAYRKKMLEYHPDRMGSWAKTDKVPSWVKKESDEMSKRINKAYEVLSDINKRKEYDKEIGVN